MIHATEDIRRTDVESHYNELDEIYRTLWGDHLHHGLWLTGSESIEIATAQLTQKVKLCAGITAGDHVCDVGCGYGTTARMLAEEYGASIIGLTLTPKQFEIAQKIEPSHGSAKFILGDWLKNDLPANYFDHVIAIESSEHMDDKRKFVQESWRVLKPGGRLTVCAWTASTGASKWQTDWLLVPICNEGRLPNLSTADEYIEMIEEFGFNLRHHEDLSQKVQKTWSLVVRRMFTFLCKHPQRALSLIFKSKQGRDFVWTPLRMWIAYHCGALNYSLLSAGKL